MTFAIIRYNWRTYESGGVMAVVRGRRNAEGMMVNEFEGGQSQEDRTAGWRYFLEMTDLKAGINPQEASYLRQRDLEIRESNEMSRPATSDRPTHGKGGE